MYFDFRVQSQKGSYFSVWMLLNIINHYFSTSKSKINKYIDVSILIYSFMYLAIQYFYQTFTPGIIL